MIGAAVFGLVVFVLTLVEYPFLQGIGWSPVAQSGVPWPSGLALGPYGSVQVANFLLFGLTMIIFAIGLHRGVNDGRGSIFGPSSLVLAGAALILLGFKTDPRLLSTGPQTWHGWIHALAFLLLVGSLLLSFLFMWWRFRRDDRWRGYDRYTLLTAVLYVVLYFLPGQIALYFFLTVVLVWVEVISIRLRSISRDASPRGTGHPR